MTTPSLRISVIVATYNRAALLRDCLGQLRRQQFQPGDEVIVVDNGSTDETLQVLEHAREAFPVPLHALRESRVGKTPALNTGIAAARGEVLALTDDDVMVADDWLATVRKLFSDPTLALAGGRVDPRWERPAPSWLQFDPAKPYGRLSSPLALLHYGDAQPLGARTAVGANLIVRRAVLDDVGGLAPELGRARGNLLCGEDHDFCQRVVRAGYRCEYRPELRVSHWVPAERLSLRYFARWFYWSGITHAQLDGNRDGRVPRYLWRRLATAPPRTMTALLLGRRTDAVSAVVDAAFALGFVNHRLVSQKVHPVGSAAWFYRLVRGSWFSD